MKRYFITTFLFAALLGVSMHSYAETADYYFGLGIGNSQFDLNESNITSEFTSLDSSSSFSDDATSFSLFAGIPLDQYLSLEADFQSTGDISATGPDKKVKLFDTSTLAITAVISRQVNDNVSLFGKVGAHFWDISEGSDDLDTIDSAIDLIYGLGADINLYGDRSRQLRVQWNHFEYDGVLIESNDTFSISLLFLIGGD